MNFKLENETICLSMMNYITFFFLLSFIFTIKQIALELHDKFVTKHVYYVSYKLQLYKIIKLNKLSTNLLFYKLFYHYIIKTLNERKKSVADRIDFEENQELCTKVSRLVSYLLQLMFVLKEIYMYICIYVHRYDYLWFCILMYGIDHLFRHIIMWFLYIFSKEEGYDVWIILYN